MLKNFVAYRVALDFHLQAKSLKVPVYLRDQVLRASASIVLNLAEGSGKRTPDDQRRYYSMALGSIRECEAILDLAEIEENKTLAQLGRIVFKLAIGSNKKRRQTPDH